MRIDVVVRRQVVSKICSVVMIMFAMQKCCKNTVRAATASMDSSATITVAAPTSLISDTTTPTIDSAINTTNNTNYTDTLILDSVLSKTELAARGYKLSPGNSQLLTVLIVPALMIAGIMPWVIPTLNMMVMFVGMVNNFALSSAFFTLVRNYIFNGKAEEHIIYVNHGYKKGPPKEHLEPGQMLVKKTTYTADDDR